MRTESRKLRGHVGSARFLLEAAYVALIAGLAIVGMASESNRPILLVSALLALPCGLAAIAGLYVLTGLFNWIAAGFSTYNVTHETGGCNLSGHCWTRTWGTPVGARGFLFSACVAALFVGAALANILIFRSVVSSRSNSKPMSAYGWPT